MKHQNQIKNLTSVYNLFLDVFPFQEMNHLGIKMICKKYREENRSRESAYQLLSRHREYFEDWALFNRAINTFYC
jgi:hypothetical protein